MWYTLLPIFRHAIEHCENYPLWYSILLLFFGITISFIFVLIIKEIFSRF